MDTLVVQRRAPPSPLAGTCGTNRQRTRGPLSKTRSGGTVQLRGSVESTRGQTYEPKKAGIKVNMATWAAQFVGPPSALTVRSLPLALVSSRSGLSGDTGEVCGETLSTLGPG